MVLSNFGKRVAVAACTASLALGGMVGCAGQEGQAPEPETKQSTTVADTTTDAAKEEVPSVSELVSKIKEADSSDNARMTGRIQIDMTMAGATETKADGTTEAKPDGATEETKTESTTPTSTSIMFDLDYDCDGTNAHGTMMTDMSGIMDAAGADAEAAKASVATVESYIETDAATGKVVTYTRDPTSSDWYVTEADAGSALNDSVDSVLTDAAIKDATVVSTDDGYRIMFGSEGVKALMGSLNSVTGSTDMSGEITDDSAVSLSLDVNSNYQVTGMSMFASSDDANLGISSNMTFDLQFSEFGKIQESSVKVPEDVKTSAKKMDELTDAAAAVATDVAADAGVDAGANAATVDEGATPAPADGADAATPV